MIFPGQSRAGRVATFCLGATLCAPLYAAQSSPQEPSGPSPAAALSQADAEHLPLQPATTVPSAVASVAGAPALTTEQYNEMLEALRTQVAQQRALLQMLAQRSGTLPPESQPVPSQDTTGSPVPDAQSSVASQPATAPDAIPVTGTESSVSQATPAVGQPSVTPDSTAVTTTGTSEPASVAPAVHDASGEMPAPSVPVLADNPVAHQAYASGVSVWREIRNSVAMQEALGIHLDPQLVLMGLEDSAGGKTLKLSEQAITDAMSSLNVEYQTRAADERKRQETDGKAYRIAFSKEKGAFSDAGSWYQILSKGSGRTLSVNDSVQLSVTGTLPDGTVFDASGQNGQVRQVKVGALLPAVAIGLQKIAPDGHIKIVVPPAKGYGDTGLPPAIPGGSTLIFDIRVKGRMTRGEG